MTKLKNIHPGEVLNEEFLIPLNITPYRLAKGIEVQQSRVGQIIRGERAISPDTAIRLSLYLHTTPHFWLNLQALYDLAETEQENINKAK